MRFLLVILVSLTGALSLAAQTSGSVSRVAIISDSEGAAAVGEVLTAQLSGDTKLQLVERDQIAKVYREQGLSAANTDYVKLGQLLGAEGLFLLQAQVETVKTNSSGPPTQMDVLHIQLVAVKPGVILTAQQFSWPVTQGPMEWAAAFASQVDAFLPKLAVHGGDAIPVSVVNIRSAINSDEAQETERQLKSLTIERLSREPQVFVLERQRMNWLSGEKDLKMDDSAFWNGSYLLEGVADQNGYLKDTITINARLTPPRGGGPILLAVSGARTNLAEVVNELAVQVDAALKIHTTVSDWNAADEAEQYYAETKWALRWGLHAEAEAASESAWALGKRDVACAQMRIQGYLQELAATACHYQSGDYTISSGYKEDGTPLGPAPSDARVQATIQEIRATYKNAIVLKITSGPGSRDISYIYSDQPPEAGTIARAIHALELYEEFSRTSPDGEPKILSRGKGWNDWHNSDWYQLGIDDLVAASKVLQSFHFLPEARAQVADELAELRARARLVAELISAVPSVHDSYFVGDRIVSRDELNTTMVESPNIFRCKLDWGGYWQETPEAAVALYRQLMESPVFGYLHSDLWHPPLDRQRLVAWNEADEKHIPAVWGDFVQELGESTNVLWQMEAKALVMADADTKEQAQAAHDELMAIIRAHRQELVENNVELFYMDWGLDYPNPELESMDQEYWQTTYVGKTGKGAQTAFGKEEAYLKNNTPYDFPGFMTAFDDRDYTKAQAAEILPLLKVYESNLVAQAAGKAFPAPFQAKSNCQWIDSYVVSVVNNILRPKLSLPRQAAAMVAQVGSAPMPPARPKIVPRMTVSGPEVVSNVLVVTKFLPIPLDGLPGDQISGVTITAHHWLEGKLLLDFQYGAAMEIYDEKGNWQGTRNAMLPAIAILDPETEHWEVIGCPGADITTANHYYHHSTLLHGEIFNCNGGQIRKYDFNQRQWQVLPVSNGENFELFAVNNHLFAANGSLIFEILEDGKSSAIIASRRRQPPVSRLDTQDFGTPSVDAASQEALQITLGDKAFVGNGGLWQEQPAESLPGDLPPPLAGKNLPAVVWNGNRYMLAGREPIKGSAGHREQGGYDAALFCAAPDLPEPMRVYLKFEAPGAVSPVDDQEPNLTPVLSSHAVMQFTDHDLFLAAENSINNGVPMPYVNPGASESRAGIWRLPLAELEPAFAAQRLAQREDLAKAAADVKQNRANLLTKYDLNHNGVIGPEEREAALNDPAFIESALDEIDTNGNGWLDVSELAWFDANQNKIMEANEQAGVDIAMQLLAGRLVKRFDTKGNGSLNMMDYNAMIHGSLGLNANTVLGLEFDDADEDHDGQVGPAELENFMRRRLEILLRNRGMPGRFGNRMIMGGSRLADPQRDFRLAVEVHWRNPDGLSGRTPFNPFGNYNPDFSTKSHQGNPP